ncbi:hypothetical protein [Geofilum rhodophaeum]|uniref:hypothetical protein n=1 Tax=Geofilum rhodophaeum TaxID=1965019 RepID=UPI000B526A3C|nr:hypothetical protein [Geofilum rhodophaeum]
MPRTSLFHKIPVCIFIPLVAFVQVTAQSVSLYHPDAGRTKVEQVQTCLSIRPQPGPSKRVLSAQSAGAAMAALLPSAVASGVGLVRSQLKKREEAYTAEYRASASASGFWRNRLEAGWPLLHLYRMAAPGDTLLSLLLCPEQSEDGLAFRYRLEDFRLYRSSARVDKRHPTLDVEVDIQFIGFMPVEGQYVGAVLGQSAVVAQGVSFDRPYDQVLYSGWFPVLPKVDTPTPNGNYEFRVVVKEANPGALKTAKVLRFFDENAAQLQETTRLVIEQATR